MNYDTRRNLYRMALRARPCPECRDPLCNLARAIQATFGPRKVKVRRPSPAKLARARLAKLRASVRKLRASVND